MSEENDKFVKVPQITIDGEKYHADAKVSLGLDKEVAIVDVGGNKNSETIWKLKKLVTLGKKVVSDRVMREEKGNEGRLVILNALELELEREVKRLRNE
jgi:hypothetical protein